MVNQGTEAIFTSEKNELNTEGRICMNPHHPAGEMTGNDLEEIGTLIPKWKIANRFLLIYIYIIHLADKFVQRNLQS